MLNALLLTVAIATPAHDHHETCGHLQELDGRIAMIVDSAWQEVQKKDEKHENDLKRDREMGEKYSKEVEKEEVLSKNEASIARVQRIANEFIQIANATQVKVSWGDKRLNAFDYQFKVIEGKDINAFSLPGGFIYVYEGLLDFVESDDELAGVISHEIAHASLRHVATLIREQGKLSGYTIPLVLASIFAGRPEIASATQFFEQAKRSGWSVEAEEAADYAGFQYMTHSKYNPVGILTFMERLAKKDRFIQGLNLGIFTTHPPSRERANTLTEHLKAAGIPIRRSLASNAYRVLLDDNQTSVDGLFNGKKVFTFAGEGAQARASAAADKLNAFFDTVPNLFEVKVNGGKVQRLNTVLLEFKPQDGDPEWLAKQSLENIKASLVDLGWRVWDIR